MPRIDSYTPNDTIKDDDILLGTDKQGRSLSFLGVVIKNVVNKARDLVSFNILDSKPSEGQIGWSQSKGTALIGISGNIAVGVTQSSVISIHNPSAFKIKAGLLMQGDNTIDVCGLQNAVRATDTQTLWRGILINDTNGGENGHVMTFGETPAINILPPNGELWAIGDVLGMSKTDAGGLSKNTDNQICLIVNKINNSYTFFINSK
jgi:hypothetical protein